jgi:tetratricopeptide (TPR) repeat protein
MNPDSPTTRVSRPPAARNDPSSAVGRLAGDMFDRWRRGERPLAEDYLDRVPELRDDPGAALELIAEELALRDEFGPPTTADELAARFPRWQAQVRALVECQRAIGPRPAPSFPSPGDTLGGFRLVAELGRGAHGRVYLAEQRSLAGRPVVLKLGPTTGDEHLSLARLQHTHIVPLYSAHEFPDRGLRGLCLPYFGGATLAAVLERLARPGPVAGRDVLAALGEAGSPDPAAPPPRGPAWGFLEQAAYPDAVCWVGVCLAEALRYAHDRGILHLDLKPSNVLLAADGTPMLLDFHLARPPLRAGDPAPGWLGGTPGYMAPEQSAAIRAVREAAPIPADLDARADVFALGVVLTQMLRPGGPDAAPVPAPVGLTDVLARCTVARPADRYPTAAALAADLRRHLADLPLKGVSNRSLAERWGKWRRRRPHALPLVLGLVALLVVGAGLAARSAQQADRAEAALREGEGQLNEGRYAEAAQALRAGEGWLDGVPLRRELRSRLREARRAAERGQAADALHAVCESVRPLYGADVVTADQLRVEAHCRALWDRREELAAALEGQPTADRERRWRADLLDLGILTAHLGSRAATPAAHRRALDVLDEAESLLGPNGVLYLERERHARALGMIPAADEAARRAGALPPRTAWEHLAAGRAALGSGDLDRAAADLERAVALDPRSAWANYHAGTCRLRRGDPAGALAAFAACVTLAPDSGWCFYNRGLAHAELGRLGPARADLDRALELDPGLGAALVARAGVSHRAGRSADALADLRRASGLGVPAAAVEYQRAVVLLGSGERAGAVASLRACLAHDPAHRPARDLLSRLTGDP